MSVTLEARRQAAREVGRFVATREGRALFSQNRYPADTRILPVNESEPFDLVIADHIEHGESTLVAVFFPERSGPARFEFLLLEVAQREKPLDWDAGDAMPLGTGNDGHTPSIGMVVDMVSGRNRRFSSESDFRYVKDLMTSLDSRIFAHV